MTPEPNPPAKRCETAVWTGAVGTTANYHQCKRRQTGDLERRGHPVCQQHYQMRDPYFPEEYRDDK